MNTFNTKSINLRKKIVIALAILTTATFALLPVLPEHRGETQVEAGSTQCPSGYSTQQCYDYLLKLKKDLGAEKRKIEAALKSVRGEAGDIQAQVNSINAKIQATENDLATREIDIELLSIEISNVGQDIADTKNRIDTLTQERNSSVQKINELVMTTYKIKSIPTWYLLSQNDLISTLEMIKYYDYLAEQENTRLTKYANLQHQLDAEESVLAEAQADIIEKRNSLEEENQEIVKLKAELNTQKSEQTRLLAELKKEEAKLAAQKKELEKQQNAASAAALAEAMKLYNSGGLGGGQYVSQGQIIGYQGHTGCAFGSHLHFGIISSNSTSYGSNVNPFSSGYLSTSGGRVYSSKGTVFYSGALITQWFHDGMFIDTVSTSEGNQSGARYYIKKGALKCAPYYSGYHYLRGEGAPIRAMLSGKVYRGVDRYGGNYALVVHNSKLKTFYFHLK